MSALKIVSVCLDRPKTDTAKSVNLQNSLPTSLVGNNEDVGFFTNTDLVANAVDFFSLAVGVKREIIESAVCQSVAFIFCILLSAYEAYFCEIRNAFMYIATIPKTGELADEFRGHNFMVFAAILHLKEISVSERYGMKGVVCIKEG